MLSKYAPGSHVISRLGREAAGSGLTRPDDPHAGSIEIADAEVADSGPAAPSGNAGRDAWFDFRADGESVSCEFLLVDLLVVDPCGDVGVGDPITLIRAEQASM